MSGAGEVRTLSREEIEELALRGEITPVSQIPLYRWRHRVCYPERSWSNPYWQRCKLSR